jgi:hypothetical protein
MQQSGGEHSRPGTARAEVRIKTTMRLHLTHQNSHQQEEKQQEMLARME